MATCYYKILGIPPRASQEEIKRAFRVLALRWHPDRNPGDPQAAEHFKEVLRAYETLVDKIQRTKYDKSRRLRKPGRRDRSNGTFKAPADGSGFSSLDEILQDAFGVDYERRKTRRGRDLRFDLQVTRLAVTQGSYEDIVYQRFVFCPKCSGNGGTPVFGLCEACVGMGETEESCMLRIWIPPGSEEGTRLKFSGRGDQPIPGAPPGDLVVFLYVI